MSVYILYGYHKAFYSTWASEDSSERKYRLGVFSSKDKSNIYKESVADQYDYFSTAIQILDNPS